jgi:glycosyltransferase involved in cell wall biosynthesis
MNELRLSVVIPTHNRAHLVGRALRSVLSEISPDDEVLVIDDGSTDGTGQVVQAFQDDRIRYIWQANAGAGAARNRGTREATGDLLAFLDSDDEWLPGRVALQRRFMAARPDILFSFTDLARDFGGHRHPTALKCWRNDTNGWKEAMGSPKRFSWLAALPAGIPDLDVYIGDIYRVEMHASYLSAICMMVRRREVGDAVRFAEGVATFEDWECFGHLAQLGRTAHLDFVGALQHRHPGPRITDADWVARAESRLVVLKNVWGSDAEFLSRHGAEYNAVVYSQQLAKVRGLLVLGRTRQARHEILNLTGVPLSYRLAAWMPGPLVGVLVEASRALRGRIRNTGTLATAEEEMAQ